MQIDFAPIGEAVMLFLNKVALRSTFLACDFFKSIGHVFRRNASGIIQACFDGIPPLGIGIFNSSENSNVILMRP